jgi:hypothetical protein
VYVKKSPKNVANPFLQKLLLRKTQTLAKFSKTSKRKQSPNSQKLAQSGHSGLGHFFPSQFVPSSILSWAKKFIQDRNLLIFRKS